MADNEKPESVKDDQPKVPPRKVDPLLRYNLMKKPGGGKSPHKSGSKGS